MREGPVGLLALLLAGSPGRLARAQEEFAELFLLQHQLSLSVGHGAQRSAPREASDAGLVHVWPEGNATEASPWVARTPPPALGPADLRGQGEPELLTGAPPPWLAQTPPPALGPADQSPAELELLTSAPQSAEPPRSRASAYVRCKTTLVIFEMLPLCGPLGIDRFYLGCWKTGLAKLAVSLGTSMIGGVIWGLIDAIAVMVNAIRRETHINVLGLEAEFRPEGLARAHTLAVVAVILQVIMALCCSSLLRRLGRKLWLAYRGTEETPRDSLNTPGKPDCEPASVLNKGND